MGHSSIDANQRSTKQTTVPRPAPHQLNYVTDTGEASREDCGITLELLIARIRIILRCPTTEYRFDGTFKGRYHLRRAIVWRPRRLVNA